MICWRHEDQDDAARLARGAATTCLGAERTGLETAGHRRSTRRDGRCRQPMAQAGARAGRGRVAAPSRTRSATAPERRAVRPAARPRGPRAGSVRLPRPGVDLQAGGGGHPAHLGRQVSPSACQSALACRAAQRAAPGRAGSAAQRGRHPGLVAAALARAGKKATDEGRTVVWVDQSGFYLLPLAVRTWAPCGQTPLLRVPLTHDHLSAISGITAAGRLFMQTQEHAYRSPDVVRFLRLLLRKIRGKLLVIWDGAPIHRGQPIKDFLRKGAARRLHLEQLPGYAPELNPDEGIWNYLKRVELGNRCCHDMAELALALRRAKERLRHKPHVIQACISHAGYHV